MQHKIKAIPLAVALLIASLPPAWAGRVLRVSDKAAQEGSVAITVHVEGGGVLLDFGPTGERIENISIDDPSRVVVSHCLVTKSCGDRPSPIIRLSRSTGINFQDIPTAKTTMLSVITIDSQGEYHSYPFPVTIGTGRSPVSKILIGEDSDNTLTGNTVAPATVALGVEEAEAKSFLVDPQLKGRVRQYLQLLQSGMSSKKAAERAGISADLAARLVQLGEARVLTAKVDRQRFYLLPTLPIVTFTPPVIQQPATRPQNDRKLDSTIAKDTLSTPPLPRPQIVISKPGYKPSKNHLQAAALVKGLVIAKFDKKISPNTAAKVQDVIAKLRRGQTLATAAKVSGVSMEDIKKLLLLAQE